MEKMVRRKMKYLLLLFALLHGSSVLAAVSCLSGDGARDAFATETMSRYFSLLEARDISAKLGHVISDSSVMEQREQAIKEYRKAVLECTPAELQALQQYVAIIQRNATELYPALVARPWKFIKTEDSIEGGLPHTRGDAIVLSSSVLAKIRQSAEQQNWNINIIELLLHEQVHVVQRVKAEAFSTLYRKSWGFKRVESISGAEKWMKMHQVVNPDALDLNWVWPVPGSSRVIWPRVVFNDAAGVPNMPNDFLLVAIELDKRGSGYQVKMNSDGKPVFKDLNAETSYRKKFEISTSIYHPYEIAADYISDLVIYDCLLDKDKMPKEKRDELDKAFKSVRAWARKNLG